MYLLTLQSEAPHCEATRALCRALARESTPAVTGLLSRHWHMANRGSLRGRYLFKDRESAEAFAAAPASGDPAIGLLHHGTALAPPLIRIGKAFDRAFFDRPVFIVSSPRSGSTLLYEVLCNAAGLWNIDGESHGIIEGIPGLHPAQRHFESHQLEAADAGTDTATALYAGFATELRNHLGYHYLDLPAKARPKRVRLLEKTPENALRIPFLDALFPSARFIFLHRDARQTVNSLIDGWRHGGFVNIAGLPGWERRDWCFLLPPGWRSLNGADLSDIAAFQWRSANTRILDDLEALPRERWTVVEYADLIAAPQAVVKRLCRFMEIDCDPSLEAKLSPPLPLSSTTISPPSPIKWRSNANFRESSLAGLGPLMGRLRDLTDHAIPPPPRHFKSGTKLYFSCFIDEIQPVAEPGRGGNLVVNPGFHFQLGQSVPLPLLRRTRFREHFLPDHPLLWIEDTGNGALYPYWTRQNQARLFMGFKAGQKPPAPLAENLEAQLKTAGVLVNMEEYTTAKSAAEHRTELACREFAAERFCKLSSLLHPVQIEALTRYYSAMIGTGEWKLGDGQVERRYGRHNEPIARYFHHQLTSLVSHIAGEPVKPTYAYVSAYQGGAALRAHLDRRQCEFTMSLLLDREQNAAPWPLWFQTHEGKTSLNLDCGDAVLFRGCELPHWREAALAEQFATMLLFHYVPSSFRGALD